MSGDAPRSDASPEASERDLVLAAKGGSLKFVGALLTNFGSFVVAITLSRFLGVVPFGQYRLGLTISDLLAQIVDFGMTSSALRFVPQARRAENRSRLIGVVRVTCGAPWVLGVLMAIGLVLLADPIAERIFGNSSLGPVFRAFALAIPFNALLNSSEALTRAFNRIDYSVLGRDIGSPLVRIIATLAALGLGFGVRGAALAHAIGMAAGAIILVTLARRLVPGVIRARAAVYPLREIRDQSLPIYMARLLQTFGGRVETLVLGVFGMAAGLGIYGAALQLSRLAYIFHESLASVSLPIISAAWSEGGAPRLAPIFRTATGWAFTVTLPLSLTIVLYAKPLLSLFGTEFTDGHASLLVLALVPLFNAATSIANVILAMTGNARLNTLNSIVFLVLTLGFDLVLIPSHGAFGAAVALALTTFVVGVLRLVEVQILFGLRHSGRSLARAFSAGGAAALVCLALGQLPIPFHPLVNAGIGIMALFSTYVAVLALLGFSEEDRVILDRVWQRLGRRGGR